MNSRDLKKIEAFLNRSLLFRNDYAINGYGYILYKNYEDYKERPILWSNEDSPELRDELEAVALVILRKPHWDEDDI